MDYSEKYLFIVYYTIYVDKSRDYKTFIKSKDRDSAKDVFTKKIKKDCKGLLIKNLRIVKVNRSKYRGVSISDKQWESLKKISYPNSKHVLSKLPKDCWFRRPVSKNRNADGTFKMGNTPWNKNFKIKFIKKNKKGCFSRPRDGMGRFRKGCKCLMVGVKDETFKKLHSKK